MFRDSVYPNDVVLLDYTAGVIIARVVTINNMNVYVLDKLIGTNAEEPKHIRFSHKTLERHYKYNFGRIDASELEGISTVVDFKTKFPEGFI